MNRQTEDDVSLATTAWRIIDPRPIQGESPFTFFVPSEAEKAALTEGDLVKLMFEGTDNDEFPVERMWVIFQGRDTEGCFGHLDNQPIEIRKLDQGDRISFQDHHIVSVWEPKIDLDTSEEDKYFARCYVDPILLGSDQKIGRLERRKPPMRWWRRKPERFQDTGWHIYAEGKKRPWRRNMQWIAIGVVLNKDASIQKYLHEPVGTRLTRVGDQFQDM